MRAIAKRLVRFVKQEDGPTALEYAVMLALIIVVCLAAIGTVGSQANNWQPVFQFIALRAPLNERVDIVDINVAHRKRQVAR